MVARQTQSPRSSSEKVDRLGERHDELRRASSQAQPTLRDGQGNTLELNGDGVPQLTATDNGVALVFNQDGSISVTTADGTASAPFSASALHSDGNVSADVSISAGLNVIAAFDLYGRNIYLTGGAIFSQNTDGAVRFHTDADGGGFDSCNRSGSEYRGVRSSNFLTVTPSWRAVKTHHRTAEEYLGRSAGEVVDGLQIGAWRYDPDRVSPNYADGRDHFGLMLDELPLEFTRTVQTPGGQQVTTYDRDEVLNLALAAVQERGREVDQLRGEVAELRARLDALTTQIA